VKISAILSGRLPHMMIDRVRGGQVPHREWRVELHTHLVILLGIVGVSDGEGRHLGDLFRHLCQYRVQTVQVVDPLHAETLAGDAAVVSGIEIAET
jgi:hypothetical protein